MQGGGGGGHGEVMQGGGGGGQTGWQIGLAHGVHGGGGG